MRIKENAPTAGQKCSMPEGGIARGGSGGRTGGKTPCNMTDLTPGCLIRVAFAHSLHGRYDGRVSCQEETGKSEG